MLSLPEINENHRDVNTGNQEEGAQKHDLVKHSYLPWGVLKKGGRPVSILFLFKGILVADGWHVAHERDTGDVVTRLFGEPAELSAIVAHVLVEFEVIVHPGLNHPLHLALEVTEVHEDKGVDGVAEESEHLLEFLLSERGT